jgi:CDP-diacylglycerol--serine O-phosphatidyltransferase
MKLISLYSLKEFGKKKKFIIPCIFTLLNACFGFFSIIKTLEFDFVSAAYFIVGAAWMDMIDGRIARLFGSTSAIGKELDSLADAVSFCVAPAILLHTRYCIGTSYISAIVLSVYICAGLSRLARFNVSKPTFFFIGLPTPIAAFFVTQLVLQTNWLAHNGYTLTHTTLLALVLLLSLLMISPIRYPSFKKLTPALWGGIALFIMLLFLLCLISKLPFFLTVTMIYLIFGSLFQYVYA